MNAIVVCLACGTDASPDTARLDAWHVSRDGRVTHCRPCADLHVVVLDDQLLYWPQCGHLDDDDALYDRPVCVVCEPGAG